MSTYKQIQEWVRENFRFTVQTCWIADVKEKNGLEPRRAANRVDGRKNPCPQDKEEPIKKAFEHFGMIRT
ncbi:hypothetical protein KAI68_03030 [bacterium]|nr:hypothetical protein [bacterium]